MTLTAKTPAETEAASLANEAARCWASATGLSADLWLSGLEPLSAPLAAAVRAALVEGASVAVKGPWRILVRPEGTRLVVDLGVLREAME